MLNLLLKKTIVLMQKVKSFVMRCRQIISIVLSCFNSFICTCREDTQISLILSFVAAAPTSFEGPYGRIIYRVRAFIDTPRFAKDYKIEKLFSMNNTVNLNEIPGIQVNDRHMLNWLKENDHKFEYL